MNKRTPTPSIKHTNSSAVVVVMVGKAKYIGIGKREKLQGHHKPNPKHQHTNTNGGSSSISCGGKRQKIQEHQPNPEHRTYQLINNNSRIVTKMMIKQFQDSPITNDYRTLVPFPQDIRQIEHVQWIKPDYTPTIFNNWKLQLHSSILRIWRSSTTMSINTTSATTA